MPTELEIERVTSHANVNSIRVLFLEYAESLGFDLCFQNFKQELKELPGEYVSPKGALFLATCNGESAGCVALRQIDNTTCEMKRLYVRLAFRGLGLGRKLSVRIIHEAILLGYSTMRLDTVPSMIEAIHLYQKIGFQEIQPYRPNPIPGALYMELNLRNLKLL